ncbi:hypothetical protein EVG20_g5285 [Dentipellis fragilis]|uniref:G-protein coupled receptors family 1 profile domain-containing protein n=1 Tax=Dentipellis fragilis TaxID=205917 RepID=A0A4Y9YTP6_9AGAM|nr:hypothetical protein EVG20_g5285 [Dentipellis fragilis]
MLNIAQAHLYGAILESVLYGTYLSVLFGCICVFKRQSKEQTRTNKIILLVIGVMFILASVHFAFTIRGLQVAFFRTRPELPEYYFNNVANLTSVICKSLMSANMIIADALLTFRLYIVYQGNIWIVVFPCITMLGTAVSAFMILWNTAHPGTSSSIFTPSLESFAPGLFVLPFVTDVTVSVLILARIIRADRAVQSVIYRKTNTSLYFVLIANLVESCLFYPVLMLVTLVLFLTKNPGVALLSTPLIQIVSLVPAVLWIQVRLGFSQYDAAASYGSESTLNDVMPKPFQHCNFSDMSTLALATATSRPSTPEP